MSNRSTDSVRHTVLMKLINHLFETTGAVPIPSTFDSDEVMEYMDSCMEARNLRDAPEHPESNDPTCGCGDYHCDGNCDPEECSNKIPADATDEEAEAILKAAHSGVHIRMFNPDASDIDGTEI